MDRCKRREVSKGGHGLSQFLLYLDEDSQARALVKALQTAGLDVVTSFDSGMDGRSDAEQLAFAIAAGRVIYTRNKRDFRVLHGEHVHAGRTHTGMIFWSANMSIGEQVRRIVRIWSSRTAEDMANSEDFLSQWGEERPA